MSRRGTSTAGVAGLRRRLLEAEATIDAIRQGRVEALVIDTPAGEQVHTLRRADEPYRLLVEHMREGAVTLDGDGRILYANPRFEELVGLSAADMAGHEMRRYLADEDQPRLERLLSAPEFAEEVRLRRPSGGTLAARLSSAMVEINGTKTVAVIVTDLTHERTARGLREANRLKDEFLATLSHELRTPLNVILGWTRMLLSGQLPEGARQHALSLIDRNAQAQAQLINDLVDMSRMTTGHMRLEIEPTPLIPVLETAVDSAQSIAEAKAIDIETAWGERDLTVLADPSRLQQVLWNLLSNAVKFTPAGGQISVRATRADDRVIIEVSDTGIGIDADFLPYVFDRFRQADGSNTRRYGGLGLGLAIVRDLVQLHGGDVGAQSRGPGQGATFTVTLRLSETPIRARERRRHFRLPGGLAGHTVLLVERHDDSRDVLTHILHRAGAVVAAFADGESALAALERVRPSAVVASAPTADSGARFITRLRRHPADAIRSVPAIAVLDADADATGGHLGYQRALTKPIEPHRLVQAILDLLRRPKGLRRKATKSKPRPATSSLQ